jgi:chitodextrinase
MKRLLPLLLAFSGGSLSTWASPQVSLSVDESATLNQWYSVAASAWPDSSDEARDVELSVYKDGAFIGGAGGSEYCDWANNYIDSGYQTTYTAIVVNNASQQNATTQYDPCDHNPPSTPTGLYVSSVGPDWIMLSWNASTDSESSLRGYNLSFSGGWPEGGLAWDIPTTQIIIRELQANLTYQFGVEGVDRHGNQSNWSNTLSVTFVPGATPPSITSHPQTQSVAVGGNVTFNVGAWGSSPFTYQWRKDGTNITGATNSALTLTNLLWSSAGGYSVVVSNSAGTATSNVATLTTDWTPPSVPTGLQSGAGGGAAYALSWSASTDNVGVTGYEVFRNGTSLGTATTTSMNLTGTSFTNYSMTVRARDATGNWSAQSAPLSVNVADATPPAAPTALNYAEKTATTVTLVWRAATDNVGVSGYTVFRGATQIGSTGDLVYADTGLAANTAYGYSVKAFDAAGNFSVASSTFNVTTTQDFSADTDHDGIPDATEAVLGTNPNTVANGDTSNQTQQVIHRPKP